MAVPPSFRAAALVGSSLFWGLMVAAVLSIKIDPAPAPHARAEPNPVAVVLNEPEKLEIKTQPISLPDARPSRPSIHDILMAPTDQLDVDGAVVIDGALALATLTPNPGVSFAKATPVISRSRWVREPSLDDLAKFYPERAVDRGRSGEVELDCIVKVTGRLECVVTRESPAGWGFGEAAQRIAASYQMEPAMEDGRPIEATYHMKLPFALSESR